MNKISLRPKNNTRRVQFHPDQTEIRTEQAHANASDINTIMRKYHKTGLLPEPVLPGVYGDFSTAVDFHTAQDKIIDANNLFNALPSDIRTTFKNDPGLFYQFVNDDENRAECQAMGLVAPDDPKIPALKPADPPPATDKEEGGNASEASEPPKKKTD